jgi:hypothetical protein
VGLSVINNALSERQTMATTPDSPEALLTRGDLAAALTALGLVISEATLATRASRPGRHGGPPYRLFSGRALYRWGDALAWAESTAGAPCRNTSERQVQAAA